MAKNQIIKPHEIIEASISIGQFSKYYYTLPLPDDWSVDAIVEGKYQGLLNKYTGTEFFTYSKSLKKKFEKQLKSFDTITIKENKIEDDFFYYDIICLKQQIEYDPILFRFAFGFGYDQDVDVFFTIDEETVKKICGEEKYILIKNEIIGNDSNWPKLELKLIDWERLLGFSPKNYDDLLNELAKTFEKNNLPNQQNLAQCLEHLDVEVEIEFQNSEANQIAYNYQDDFTRNSAAQNAVVRKVEDWTSSNIIAQLLVNELIGLEDVVSFQKIIVEKAKKSFFPFAHLIMNGDELRNSLALCKEYLELEKENSIEEIILLGEGKNVEFKSSIRYDIRLSKINKDRERDILKTIVGFLNSEGGLLIIGVEDDGNILGIKNDGFKNNDKALLHIDNLVHDKIKPINSHNYISRVQSINKVDIIIIEVKESGSPVFLNWQGNEEFFIRSGPSTRRLSQSETLSYVNQNFK